MRLRQTWIELESPPELPLGTGPVPIKSEFDVGKGSVSFRKHIVQLNCPYGCGLRFGHYLQRSPQKRALVEISIRQTCIRQGIIGVNRERLLEVFNGLLNTFFFARQVHRRCLILTSPAIACATSSCKLSTSRRSRS